MRAATSYRPTRNRAEPAGPGAAPRPAGPVRCSGTVAGIALDDLVAEALRETSAPAAGVVPDGGLVLVPTQLRSASTPLSVSPDAVGGEPERGSGDAFFTVGDYTHRAARHHSRDSEVPARAGTSSESRVREPPLRRDAPFLVPLGAADTRAGPRRTYFCRPKP